MQKYKNTMIFLSGFQAICTSISYLLYLQNTIFHLNLSTNYLKQH